jgi:FO synthase
VTDLAAPSGLARAERHPVGRPWALRLTAPTALGDVLRRAERSPDALADADWVALLESDGDALDALTDLADRVRADTVGDRLSYVVNRNIDGTLLGELTLDDVADLADEAWTRGATEICVQGAPSSAMPATALLDLVGAVKDRRPGLHLHAFRPA